MRRVTDREFAPPATLPFPPGTGLFRQKGNAFTGDFEYFSAKVPGGPGAVLAAVPDAATRTFLSQRFIASEWYDAYPNVALQVAAAKVLGLSFEEHRRRVGIYHAEALSGVYRALLKVISNENVAVWGPRIMAMYWDFGKTESRVDGPHQVSAVRRGTPKGLLQWLVWASAGFAETTLRLSGARNPVVSIGDIEDDGTRLGIELCSVKLTIRWA